MSEEEPGGSNCPGEAPSEAVRHLAGGNTLSGVAKHLVGREASTGLSRHLVGGEASPEAVRVGTCC